MGRRRRTATETKAQILEAAQGRLVAHGPAGLRLDDVAGDVGVSRQAVLHHFGNREGLLRAVVARAWAGLFEDLQGFPSAASTSPDAFIDTVDDVVRIKGNARLGAWLLLSKTGLPAEVFQGALSGLPAAVQAQMPGEVSDEDAEFGLVLVAAALFGDAVFGVRIREALGLPDDEVHREAFRRWLAKRLLAG